MSHLDGQPPLDSLLVAKNHIESARWVLREAHPIMNPDEPCVHYELWAGLGELRDRIFGTSNQDTEHP